MNAPLESDHAARQAEGAQLGQTGCVECNEAIDDGVLCERCQDREDAENWRLLMRTQRQHKVEFHGGFCAVGNRKVVMGAAVTLMARTVRA